jgi:16S rRNA (guanine966-N2)-methyltransferase
MRVIAGKFRSRVIKEVPSSLTRPTTDKNKEILFNMLGQFFDGGTLLDLYAGSGALGIEGLSRGITLVDFVDSSKQAMLTIKQNLDSLGISIPKEASLYTMDAFIYLQTTSNKYDFILADPPYQLGIHKEIIDVVISRQLLHPQGLLVIETNKETLLPTYETTLPIWKERVSGSTKFTIYQKGDSL